MSFFDAGFEKCAALCIGVTALSTKVLAPGLVEAVTGGAALTGMIVSRAREYDPERLRVSRTIRAHLKKRYATLIAEDGGGRMIEGQLWAADDAMLKAFDRVRLTPADFGLAAVDEAGFVAAMASRLMELLATEEPRHFGPAGPSLSKQYARDTLEAGFSAIASNPEFYRKIDPYVTLEKARALSRMEAGNNRLAEQVGEMMTELKAVRTGVDTLVASGVSRGKTSQDDRFTPALTETLKAFGLNVERLTTDQFRVLDHLRHHRRVRVIGCAGSGKTLVACEKAARLAAAGVRTLVLCHNPLLAEHLRSLLAQPGATVLHFAALVDLLTGAPEIPGRLQPWTIYEEPLDDQVSRAFDLAVRGGLRFDAVIVDEGQDFRPEWWLLVEALLAHPEDSFLYIFNDDEQALLVGRSDYPIKTPPVEISRNCRNAASVLTAMGRFAPSHPPAEHLLESTGFVETIVSQTESVAECLPHALRRALALGLEPSNLLVVALGGPAPAQLMGRGQRITRMETRCWQDSLFRLFDEVEASQHGDHEYLGASSRRTDWEDWFHFTRVSRKDLNQLSRGPLPSAEDVELVRRLVADAAYFSHSAKQFLRDQPDVCKLAWRPGDQGPVLVDPGSRRLRAIQVAAFLQSEGWADDLVASWTVDLIAGSQRHGQAEIPLLDVGAAKGLEADVVILLVEPHIPAQKVEKYIAASRARFGLLICDPGDQLRLSGR